MRRVGLTGNIGSGKTTVARIFEVLDVPVFYSDQAAKGLYEIPEVRKQVQALFPEQELFSNGIFQKSTLASLVFTQPESLAKLNKLIHPLVEDLYQQWQATLAPVPYVVQESAILFEHGFQSRFFKVLLVTSPESIRLSRVMQRDGIGVEEALDRMKNQMTEEKKLALADYVIVNDNLQMIIPQVMEIHRALSVG